MESLSLMQFGVVFMASGALSLGIVSMVTRKAAAKTPLTPHVKPVVQDPNPFEHAPIAIWVEDADGVIVRQNRKYRDSVAKGMTFAHPPDFTVSDGHSARYSTSVQLPTQPDPQWFEVTVHKDGRQRICYANPITGQIKAEAGLRDFMQILTKTFANLPIGLLIFDSNRQLAVFNPAIGDLTHLPIEFLTSRPTLFAVLDRLRETQMMPEPKDYKSWRNEIGKMEAAAENGSYSDLWAMPNGVTYRISGRPHPDGALAFVIEDITADISLKRRFRSEIEQGHAILDCLDQAIAVFSNVGVMTFVNKGYERLWGDNPATAIVETGIVEATRAWQSLCRPSPVWGDLRDFILNAKERCDWQETIELLDGTRVLCRVEPLPNGASLVRFLQNNGVRIDADPLPLSAEIELAS